MRNKTFYINEIEVRVVFLSMMETEVKQGFFSAVITLFIFLDMTTSQMFL